MERLGQVTLKQEEGFEIATINTDTDAHIYMRIPPAGSESLERLMGDYSHLFVRYHKRPGRCQLN